MAPKKNNEHKEFADRLRQVREDLQYDQKQMAAHMRLTQGNYSKMEGGIVAVSKRGMFNLHRKLKVNLNWFVTGHGPKFIVGSNEIKPAEKKTIKDIADYITSLEKSLVIEKDKSKNLEHQITLLRKLK